MNLLANRETLAYRGYLWRRIHANIYRYEYRPMSDRPQMVWVTKVATTISLRQIAAERWRELHKLRRFGDGYTKIPYWPSADDVPWEIHEIENETAYEAALSAYKADV